MDNKQKTLSLPEDLYNILKKQGERSYRTVGKQMQYLIMEEESKYNQTDGE